MGDLKTNEIFNIQCSIINVQVEQQAEAVLSFETCSNAFPNSVANSMLNALRQSGRFKLTWTTFSRRSSRMKLKSFTFFTFGIDFSFEKISSSCYKLIFTEINSSDFNK